MRVSQISVYNNQQNYYTNHLKKKQNQQLNFEPQHQSSINFKAKFGAYLGGVIGGAAVIATAIIAAPAIACLAGGGAIIGAIGGDLAEDAVNGKSNDK